MAFDQYRGRNMGRVMHFLCRVHHRFDEMIKFGDCDANGWKIHWGYSSTKGEPAPLCAIVTWLGDTDIPIVTFEPAFKEYQHTYYHVMADEIRNHTMAGLPFWSEKEYAANEAARLHAQRKRAN